MAYKVIILYQLYMPSYFLGTFTEYPYISACISLNSVAGSDNALYTCSSVHSGRPKNFLVSSSGERFDPGYNIRVYTGMDRILLRSFHHLRATP